MNQILFFQKGKFYELYEDDAVIGHREFDLKMTDRVKMKMGEFQRYTFHLSID
jgi:DNA mismatch repair protein MSH6